MQTMERKRLRKKINLKWIIAAVLGSVLIFSVLLAAGIFRVDKVEVAGNSYYTEEEIKTLVMGDYSNSLHLMFLYDYLGGKEIPFIDRAEVSMISPNHIKIRVYEKTMIGYVEYMGANL